MRWHASFGTSKNNFTYANRSRDTVGYSKNCLQTKKFRISGSGFRVNRDPIGLVDARDPRGESWRARAPDCKSNVQARSVGITTLKWIGWRPTRHRPIARAWKGSSLGFADLKLSRCLYTL